MNGSFVPFSSSKVAIYVLRFWARSLTLPSFELERAEGASI